MAKRSLYQRLRTNAQVRLALFLLGCLLMILAPLLGPLPGPGFVILFPLGLASTRRSVVLQTAFARSFVVLAVMLFSDRDVAPVFGHLSPLAGTPHR